MFRYQKFLYLLLAGWMMAAGLSAQALRSTYLSTQNGLSNNSVYSIFQDHNGFLWFGTYDGLDRYDGYEFTVFRNKIGDSTSLRSNTINGISEDENNNLWIAGTKEVNIYNPLTGSFTVPSYLFADRTRTNKLDNNVVSIERIGKQVMLAGTQKYGLFSFENSTKLGKQVPLIAGNDNVVNYYVTSIKHDSKRKITYVSVQGKGLCVYDSKVNLLRLIENLPAQVACLDVADNGNIWLGNYGGLYQFNPVTHSLSDNVMPQKLSVVDLCEDKEGKLWIATDGGGAWILSPGEMLAKPMSSLGGSENKTQLSSNAVYAIYEDRQQRKWIGTLRGGVSIIEPRSDLFRKVVYENPGKKSPIDNFIFCFAKADHNNIWIGTDGAGLRYWNRNDNSFTNIVHDDKNPNSISTNFVTDIVDDGNGGKWVSAWLGGVNHFDPKTKQFRRYNCINPDTKAVTNYIWSLLRDSRNRLWAAAVREGGLYRFNPNTDAFELFDSRFPDLQALTEDREGNIWGGDYDNLIRFDTVSKKHQVFPIGYTVRSIYEDRKRNFWIGTQEGGLLLFNRGSGTFKRFTTSNGLPHNTILNILEDSTGNLWLSTFNGLSKFTPSTEHFKNFTQTDGLQSNQFSFHGALTLDDGEMLFGGNEGFNIFYPNQISDNRSVPPLFLSAVTVNNKPVQNNPSYITETQLDLIRKIDIPYNEATLSLGFLGLDYSDAENLNYAYRLTGWDKDWNYVKNIRTANYSRLREGNYVFEVKVSRANGVWSEPAKLLDITILPPWYRTWWAYLLYVCAAVSLIYMYLYYRDRQNKLQYEVKLANLATQQEKELNEKKIAFFTNISHEFRAPLSLIINPIKDILHKSEAMSEKTELRIVYRNAQRLLRLVDHLLLFKKAESENTLHLTRQNLVEVLNNVYDCFTEQARLNKINYTFTATQSPVFSQIDREKIEIVFFNILSNAFKHTPAGGTIAFRIEEENGRANISVTDTGSGISAEEGEKLFQRFYQVRNNDAQAGFGIGLYLVKTFIDAHHGTVTYTSAIGSGTAFTISLETITSAQEEKDVSVELFEKEASVDSDENQSETSVEKKQRETELSKNKEVPGWVPSSLLQEISEPADFDHPAEEIEKLPQSLTSEKQSLLLIDDDAEILNYLVGFFKDAYRIYKADNAEDGIKLAHEHLPDLIISDIVMKGISGIELCRRLKADESVRHIPVILLTGTSSDEIQLQAMETGADDYVKKPFDTNILAARVKSLLNRRNILQQYFYNEVTLGSATYKISDEYREFLQRCMAIIESHLEDDQFSVKVLTSEIGMSHSNLYKKVKSVSGQSVAGFIRFIRLRKAAEILINTEQNINETASLVGFNDIKYFRNQFSKQFGMTPSEYIKKYRKPFHNKHTLNDQLKGN